MSHGIAVALGEEDVTNQLSDAKETGFICSTSLSIIDRASPLIQSLIFASPEKDTISSPPDENMAQLTEPA